MKLSTGFTLIEIMIVAAIVGILMAVAYPAFQTYQCKGAVYKEQNRKQCNKITAINSQSRNDPAKEQVDDRAIITSDDYAIMRSKHTKELTLLSIAGQCQRDHRIKFTVQGTEYDITCSKPYTREVGTE